MKKSILTTAFFLCSSCVISHAGSMGPVSSVLPPTTPFVSLEGAYTWNQLNSVTVNGAASAGHDKPWGGRLAAGFIHPYSDLLRFSGELGGGYYGSQSRTVGNYGRSNVSIDGYDLLFGALYKFNQFDLFGDVGVMLQNNRIKSTEYLEVSNPGGLLSGSITTKSNQTQVLPEIKVGGIYNLSDNWGISLAYMHVFGVNTGGNMSVTPTTDVVAINGTTQTQNPTLDSALLGVRYNIG